ERYAFVHLLTEAVATVGLDYWYLSTIALDEVVPIGTQVSMLAVDYHERFLPEYRRFAPDFRVQDPEFFVELCEFYATGVFHGFAVDDLRRSPRVLGWLRHELAYGVKQREHIRAWLSYLAAGRVTLGADALRAPVACDEPWHAELAREVGQRLWRKVKDGHDDRLGRPLTLDAAWRSPVDAALDFRFRNAGGCAIDAVQSIGRGPNADENFRYFAYQYLSGFDYGAFDRDLLALVPDLVRKRDAKLLASVCRRERRVAALADEPRDLLIIN
ncbi:MAG TPA: hypothetical protein VIA18_30845, partial [Polyangia bacterium]|nr:hypothetical protein [Polyangia bacterium]